MEEGPKDSHNLPHLPSPQQPPSHTASHRQDSPPHPPKLDQKDHTPRNHPPPPAPKIHDLLRQRRPPLTTPGISIQCGGKESTASNMTQNSEPWTPPHTTPPHPPPNHTAEQPQPAQSGAPPPQTRFERAQLALKAGTPAVQVYNELCAYKDSVQAVPGIWRMRTKHSRPHKKSRTPLAKQLQWEVQWGPQSSKNGRWTLT
jgi:hypothetical protein